MTVYARYCGELVEVTDVFEGGSCRKMASIRALRGKPFTLYSMGGPVNTDSINVPASLLRQADEDECTCTPDTGEVCEACKRYIEARYEEDEFPY